MNKDLYGEEFKITDKNVQEHIKKCAKEYSSNVLWNIVENDYKIDYSKLKSLKNYFDTANSKNEEYEKKGGDVLKKEVDKLLKTSRRYISNHKKMKKDIGMSNQYNSNHQKFNTHVNRLDFRKNNLMETKQKIEMIQEDSKREACVCILMHEPSKKILMLKREPNDEWMGDKWSFVGGMMDGDEPKALCVKREIEEETGINDVTAQYCWTKETDSTNVHFFIGKTTQKDVTISDEHSEYMWCTPSEIKKIDAIPDTLDDVQKTLETYKENNESNSLNEDNLEENDQFTKNLDDSLNEIIPYLEQKLGDISKKIGDKDGQLDTERESDNVNEALLPMIAGSAMALPEIMKIVSKWGTKLGKEYNNKTVEVISKKIENAGHKLHHKYEDILIKILKPLTRKLDDEGRKKLAQNLLFSIVVTLAVSAITSSGLAFKGGDISIGSIETALGGIKVKEIVAKVKMALPQIIAQNAS